MWRNIFTDMKKVKLTNEKTALICRELELIVRSGLEAGGALALTAEESGDRDIRFAASALVEKLDSGESLASAIRKCGLFPEYVCTLAELGHATGKSEAAFAALAEHYFRRDSLERGLKNALLYPSVLILVMLAVIVLLLTKVLPLFEEAYLRLGASMGGAAEWLLGLGRGLAGAMPFVCLLLAAVAAFAAAVALSPALRERLMALWRRRERGVGKSLSEARFAGALALGLQSGMAAEEALDLASSTLGGEKSREACRVCAEALSGGVSLGSALRRSGLLPPGSCRLLELGERSGSADSVMGEIAARLTEKSEEQLQNALGRIEPALVLGCCLVIGAVLLAVMLPLMGIMGGIG